MVSIYVLELKNGKFYVGKTKDPKFRIESHFNKNGSEWTKLYDPIGILEIVDDCDDYDEDKYTLRYMAKYGINNVRGGSFCRIKLESEDIRSIQKMIRGSSDRCFLCGEKGHFAKECYVLVSEDSDPEDDSACSRCGRKSHYSWTCYAKYHVNGKKLDETVFTGLMGFLNLA